MNHKVILMALKKGFIVYLGSIVCYYIHISTSSKNAVHQMNRSIMFSRSGWCHSS